MASIILEGDFHVCPKSEGAKFHVGGPVGTGVSSVRFADRAIVVKGTKCICVGPQDEIVEGIPWLLVCDKQAGNGDGLTAHQGMTIPTCPSVRLGR